MKKYVMMLLLLSVAFGSRGAPGVRSGVIDLFPKDENRKRKSSRLPFLRVWPGSHRFKEIRPVFDLLGTCLTVASFCDTTDTFFHFFSKKYFKPP